MAKLNDAKEKTTQEKVIEFAKKRQEWKKDPIGFLKEVLGMDIPPHQRKLIEQCVKRNKISVKSANSLGKCPLREGFSVLGDGTVVKNKDLVNKEFNILTYDKNKDVQYPGTARATDNGTRECISIKTNSGKIIERTSNHPLYKAHIEPTNQRIDGRRLTRIPVVDGWTECKDLKVGDYILAPVVHQIKPSKFDFTDDECKILGYLLGDGGTTTRIDFTQEDNKQLCEFVECIEKMGSKVVNDRKYRYRVVGDGTENGNPVLNRVKEWGLYGCKSTEKLIPEFVGRLPLEQIALILNRFFACDGYATNRMAKKVYKDGGVSHFWDSKIGITLANEDLIKQIRLLLMRFGIETWMRYKPSKCGGKVFDAWELCLFKRKDIEIFCEQIGIYGKEEAINECLKHAKEKSQKRENKFKYLNCPKGFVWEKITEVKNIGQHETVCIEVDDTHTYLTEVYDHNSHCIASLAFWFFFTRLSKDPNDTTIVLITAPTFSQIKMSIFANIRNFALIANNYVKERFGPEYKFMTKDFSESSNVCEYWADEKSFIAGIATGEGNAGAGNTLSGRHATHVLVIGDEAQGITEGTFSSFKGILNGGVETKFIMLGNTTLPNGASGTFFDSFQDNSDFYQMSISAFDSPNFTEPGIKLEDMLVPDSDPTNWRQKLDKTYGTNYKQARKNDEVDAWENEVKQKMPLAVITNPISVYSILKECGMNPNQYEFLTRCLAEFPTDGGNAVINQSWIESSMNNYFNPNMHKEGIVSMGVDISGGLGRDFSTIAVRNGNKVIFLEEYQLDAPSFEDKIVEIYEKFGCEMCCIERDGIGKPIVDHLKARNIINIIPILSGGAPGIATPITYEEEEKNKLTKELYNRKRDELWFNVRDLMNPYNTNYPILLPRNAKLKKHLMCATYKKDKKIQVSPKEQMRIKIKESPDLADAVLFAFAPLGEAETYGNNDMVFMSFNNASWS